MFASVARACLRHRWIVIGAWVGLLIVVNGIASSAGADWKTDFVLPDSESKDVQELLEANDPNRAGFAGQIVVKADQGIADPEVEAAFTEIMDFAAEQPGVTVTSPYDNAEQISESEEIAYAQLDISDRGFEEITELGTDIEEFGDSLPAVQGMQVEYGGDPFSEFELPESEIYGVIAAVIILILAFGSVLAMGLPIGTALFGLGIASALVSLLSHLIPIPDFTTAMVAMIGLGVGIDYALFIVTRYREGLRLNLSVEQAVVEAMDTSGRAVLFAGVTVIISLMGLSLMGLSFVQGIAIAASIGVLMMILGSLTLLPALLGWIGTRIDHTTRAALGAVALGVIGAFFGVLTKQAGIFIFGMLAAVVLFASSFFIKALRKEVPHRHEPVKEQRMWYRWSRFIQHRPWPSLLGAAGLLIVLAIPLFGIRLGFGDYGNYNEDQTVRRAYDLLAEGFGPGTNGPMFITVEGEAASDEAAIGAFVNELNNTENVASAFPTPINDSLALVIVNPQSAPQDAETSTLVNHLRDEVIPASGLDAKVGGWTAASSDFADYMGDRMPLLIGVVLLLSFLLLMVVFRSLLVPLKAVVMNLLSIGAAYGILVAIFQWGWGLEALGVDRSGPIEAWVPMFLFAIVFGLSMDYEVFLLSRIREEYDRTKNNAVAVADGLASTARVITAAALIMFCVFGAFALGDDRQLKLFGLGLGIAVLLDATIVRMVLVPATMELLGDRNWWLPKWLDRILPRIKVEGAHHVAPVPAHTLEGEDVEREPELTR
jgi:RND superfamily putative drug exporter